MEKYLIKTIFMGTPAFTLPAFEALVKDDRFDVIAAYTQPDRPVGRSSDPMPPAVKIHAQKYDIPVYQPGDLKNETTIRQIELLEPDLIIVFAYANILPKEILNIPQYGCINIHPSLLPRWRGASPIAYAVMSGDKETGISYMVMDEKLDHGPLIRQIKYRIPQNIDARELTSQLSIAAARNLTGTLVDYIDGKIKPKKQIESGATYSRLLRRDSGRVEWNDSAATIINKLKALQPWPGIYTEWKGKKLKFLSADIGPEEPKLRPGQVKDGLVGTSKGNIRLIEVQLEGKKPMKINDFQNGNQDFRETKLG